MTVAYNFIDYIAQRYAQVFIALSSASVWSPSPGLLTQQVQEDEDLNFCN